MPPAFQTEAIGLADQDGTGLGFNSSAVFTLPNGATRSPDASWIRLERWNGLIEEQKASFAPICPDFVIELRSSSDTLTSLQDKMQEYIANGVLLSQLAELLNTGICVVIDANDDCKVEIEVRSVTIPRSALDTFVHPSTSYVVRQVHHNCSLEAIYANH